MSKVLERHTQLKASIYLRQSSLAQVRRAAFRIRLPAGYIWQDDEIRMDPNERVQDTRILQHIDDRAKARERAPPAPALAS